MTSEALATTIFSSVLTPEDLSCDSHTHVTLSKAPYIYFPPPPNTCWWGESGDCETTPGGSEQEAPREPSGNTLKQAPRLPERAGGPPPPPPPGSKPKLKAKPRDGPPPPRPPGRPPPKSGGAATMAKNENDLLQRV